MPAYIAINRVDFYLGGVVNDEDADYASSLVGDLAAEDCHTSTTLEEQLAQLTSDIEGLRIGCVYRDEEGGLHGMTAADGNVADASPGAVRRMRESEDPDARPKNRKCSAGYAKVLELEANAKTALDARDQTAALKLLDDAPRFPAKGARQADYQQRRIDEARCTIWRWLVERKKPELTFERVLRAFETERADVANVIAYSLFRIESFAKPLAEAAETSTNDLVKERCEKAINEWPDFPFAKKKEEAPQRKEGDDDANAKRPYDATAVTHDLLTATLKTLDDESPAKFRKVMRAISRYYVDELRDAVLAETATAFLPLLKEEASERTRSFAIELLVALGVPPRELCGYLVGLPRSAWVREIELSANYDLFGSLPDAQVSDPPANSIVKKPWPGGVEIRQPCELRAQGTSIVSFGELGAVRWSDPVVLEGVKIEDVSWRVKDDRACLLAGKKIVLYDRATGRRLLDLATPLRKAVLPHERGFLVWDGRQVLGEPVESGLIVMMDGQTRDVIAPIVNKSVVRTCAGMECDFSRMDVIRRPINAKKKTEGGNEEDRLRFKHSIYEVAKADAQAKVIAIRLVPGGDVLEFDPTSEPVPVDVPPRKHLHEQVIEGIDYDLSGVAKAADRAMIEAEIAEVGDGVPDFINWYSDLAKAFPRASFEIATQDWQKKPKVERASKGKIDFGSLPDEKKAHARVVRDDKRHKKIGRKALPESYVRFATARKAWRASWEEGLDVGELMGLLGDPAFSPTEPSSVVRLANAERIRMYELVVRSTPSNKPPTREIVAAIERESADVHFRVAGAWSHHDRGREALMNAALAVESPLLKERLRGVSGYSTGERTAVFARALEAPAAAAAAAAAASSSSATSAVSAAQPSTSVADQIDRALADAQKRHERNKDKKIFADAKEAIATADEASRARDLKTMLDALDQDGLWSPSASQRRDWLWSEIVRTPRKFLPFERVLRALAEERDSTAHRITYKLYVQTHFAPNLAEAVKALESRKPEGHALLLLERLKTAIEEWPDFPLKI